MREACERVPPLKWWYITPKPRKAGKSWASVSQPQGSEFKVVVMPTFMGSAFLMNRNILYTGITRAKELVVVVGNQRSLQYMVNNTNNMERYSSLKERIMDITIDKNMIE